MAESNQKGGNDGVAARACVGLRRHPLAFGVMQTLLNATKLFPYFCYGTRRSVFRSVDRYTYERVRDFLARRHKIPGRGTRRFSCEIILRRTSPAPSRALAHISRAVCLTVKPVGERSA